MKSLRDQIREAAALPEIELHDPSAEDIYKGEEQENARLLPLLDKLADVAEAADAMAMWLSAAMEDENVCSEMKRDCEIQLEALHRLWKAIENERSLDE